MFGISYFKFLFWIFDFQLEAYDRMKLSKGERHTRVYAESAFLVPAIMI